MISRRLMMSVTRLFSPYHIHQKTSTKVSHHRTLISRKNQNLGYQYLADFYRRKHYNSAHGRNFRVYKNVPPAAPLPSQPPSNKSWILGIAVSLVLPFATNKWGPLIQIKNEVDTTIETIEEIAEVVEHVAEVVDKVAEGISDKLPEGGKLKQVLEFVENVAEETAKDANIVENAIGEFQKAEEKVEQIVEALNPQSLVEETKDLKS